MNEKFRLKYSYNLSRAFVPFSQDYISLTKSCDSLQSVCKMLTKHMWQHQKCRKTDSVAVAKFAKNMSDTDFLDSLVYEAIAEDDFAAIVKLIGNIDCR